MTTTRYDVVVVGGGVLGTAVAERLARTSASVCLLEAEGDVGEHASKGNAGVAVSYYGGPGTLETELINASNPLWEELCERLDVPYRRIGGLMVALSEREAERLEHTRAEAAACGVRVRILSAGEVREAEPLVTPDAVAGLSLPDEGVIDPMRLTASFASLAAANGAVIRLRERVEAIEHEDDGASTVITDAGRYRARFVVNAAGVGAGAVSRMAGGEPLVTWPRKGQYVVVDRAFAGALRQIVFCTHLPDTKGINVVPTTHGSALLGPTATDVTDPDDRATDAETIARVVAEAARLVPAVAEAYAIKTFAANRPAGDEPHRLRVDAHVPNLVHVTDRSAGVSISPAAAQYTLDLLQAAGLDAVERPDAHTALPRIPRLRTAPEPERLTEVNPLYGQVVCACEHVSAAEIDAALSAPVPATSIDGVRKRTGAGYGRCQGSLCLAGISFLTAMATGCGPDTVRHTVRGTVGS
ncbi:NAD(P)/FAD-dependent oxidoreductase [Microbispora sp. H10885]|uniref:NAD(P)/FAD-dependent oxidoreductase n=1 Tax=Microbispora sp. H10885 TaxID=2729110 RepID=UPI0015FFD3B8|nr:FAD-dependent oxidoreductase [Microbispora sp. H10885]